MKSFDSKWAFAVLIIASCANSSQDVGPDQGADDDSGAVADAGYGEVVTSTPDGASGYDAGVAYDAGVKDSGGKDANVPADSGTSEGGGSDSGPTCNGPGEIACGGVCINGDSDPGNCGACGRSCQGQACAQGACSPVALSTEFVPLGGIAQDATTIYFVGGDGKLKSVPKAGGPTTTIASGLTGAIGVAVDATSAYVTAQGLRSVVKVALVGGAQTTLATNQTNPMAVATDGTNVYWTTYGTGAANGTVMTCATTGCNDSPTLISAQLQIPAAQSYGPHTGIVLDKDGVYWSHWGSGGEIRKAPLGGGAIQTVMSGIGNPWGISLANGTLAVVVFGADGQILLGPTTGGSKLLVGTQPFAISSAISDSAVYWTFYNPQSVPSHAQVMTCPIAGCQFKARALANSDIQPSEGIVVDSTSVYWLSNDGSVFKTPR